MTNKFTKFSKWFFKQEWSLFSKPENNLALGTCYLAVSVLGKGDRARELLVLGIGGVAGAPLEGVPVAGEGSRAAVGGEAWADVRDVALVLGIYASADDGNLGGASGRAFGNFAVLDVGSDEAGIDGSDFEFNFLANFLIGKNFEDVVERADTVCRRQYLDRVLFPLVRAYNHQKIRVRHLICFFCDTSFWNTKYPTLSG